MISRQPILVYDCQHNIVYITYSGTTISRLVAASLVSVIMISFFAGVIGISSVMYMFVCCYRLCTVFNREKYR